MNETSEVIGEMKPDPGKGRAAWRVIVALCILAIVAVVVMRLMKPEEAVSTTPLPSVSVSAPSYGDVETQTSLVGTVMPDNIYYVTPKVAGEIKEIYVSQGDFIEEGDAICLIDNSASINSAKITLDSAKIQQETAQTNRDRMSVLYASGDISQQSWESAETTLETARLQVEAAQLAYDLQVDYATVKAPVSGIVESEDMELNAMAAQTSQLCVISGTGSRKVQFSVTDRMLEGIEVGDAVSIEKQSNTFTGSITLIESIPSATTGLYTVEASIDGDDSSLVTGTGVKVYFVTSRSKDVLTIPTDAIYYDGGLTYAYTLSYDDELETDETEIVSEDNRGGTVHKVEIETGLSDGTTTEVISGLSEDDVLIVTWTAQLYEGAKVQVIPSEEA